MKNNSMQQLSEKLQGRIEQDRQQIEELTRNELKRLAQSLSDLSASELNTTRDAIKKQYKQLQSLLDKKELSETRSAISETLKSLQSEVERIKSQSSRGWIKPLVIGLSLFLGISAGSWGLMQWLSNSIQGQIEQRANLSAEIAEQRQTLAAIQAKTWGIRFLEHQGERFIVLPKGAKAESYTAESGEYVTKLLSR